MFEGFAKLRVELTSAAFLRRISRELHRANELREAEMALKYPHWDRGGRPVKPTRKPKLVDVSAPTTEEWNEAHRKRNPDLIDDEDVY